MQWSEPERPLSVSELTGEIKEQLETRFPAVWVVGEISDFARPRSGHCYLTLKDDRAQIRAVIWRGTAERLKFTPEDGLEVVCQGEIDVYPPRGSYQLVIRQITPKGLGALELALRQLRQKLAAEGLFEPERKRPPPEMVRRVAVVTSQTGAAIRDFLQVLSRRWRGAEVLVVPVPVQGEGAAEKIAQAIRTVNRFPEPPDCLVVTRGGGSLEDLWAFNEEPVVRAIAESRIVVVSAIGHEIDVTLADLAADVRAATPSEAAELVAPESLEMRTRLEGLGRRMETIVRHQIAQAGARVETVASRRVFRRPLETVQLWSRRLDETGMRLDRMIGRRVSESGRRLEAIAGHLESLSPLSVLARGYSLTSREEDRHLICDAKEVSPGDRIVTRLAQGEVTSRVEEVETGDES